MLLNRLLNKICTIDILACAVGLAFCIDILGVNKYLPSYFNFYSGAWSVAIISLALVIWYGCHKICGLAPSVFLWLSAAILILLQPLLHSYAYADSLLFPIAVLMFAALLSCAVTNTDDKPKFVGQLAWWVWLTSVGTVLSQIGQLLQLSSLYGWLIFPAGSQQLLYGNTAQPNQTAFVLSLGLMSIFYLMHVARDEQVKSFLHNNQWNKIKQLLLLLSVPILGMGLYWTASRGGVILCFAALCLAALSVKPLHAQWRFWGLYSVLFVVGFFAGKVIQEWLSIDVTVTNMAGRVLNQHNLSGRIELQQQAWLLIKDNWLLGVGFNRFLQSGYEHAEQLQWYTAATHTHLLPTQLLAEMGLLGLLLFVWLCVSLIYLVKNTQFSLNPAMLWPIAVVGLTLLYSLSEYPLWYVSYLSLFVVALALLEKPNWFKISINWSKILALVSVLFLSISLFYIYQYKQLSNRVYAIKEVPTWSQQMAIYNGIGNVYGFLHYKEDILFALMPVNKDELDRKIGLGTRVMSYYQSSDYLIKIADLYALDGNEDAAISNYQKACHINYGNKCREVLKHLNQQAENSPNEFKIINQKIQSWVMHSIHR